MLFNYRLWIKQNIGEKTPQLPKAHPPPDSILSSASSLSPPQLRLPTRTGLDVRHSPLAARPSKGYVVVCPNHRWHLPKTMQPNQQVKFTKADYLARRALLQTVGTAYSAEDTESMRRLQWQFMAENCSGIEVAGDHTLEMSAFSVYIDRYVRGTGAMDSELSPQNGIFARVHPGAHTIRLRDADIHKPDRRESNLLTVEISPLHRIVISAALTETGLHLTLIRTDTMPQGLEP